MFSSKNVILEIAKILKTIAMETQRGSYNSKNNITQQLHFLNNFVTFYSLKNLADMDTEISCNSEIDYKRINDTIPELKKYFKISGLNLSKIGNTVSTGRQALGILRKLCSQARIPYEFDKTENGYTFSLTPLNEEWCSFLRVMNNEKIKDNYREQYRENLIDNIDDILEHKTPLVSRHHITDDEWNRLNPDVKYVDKPEYNDCFYARALLSQEFKKEFDLRYTCIKTICVHPENNNDTTVRIEGMDASQSIPPPTLYYRFGRRDDVIESVKEIQVFDEKMNLLEMVSSDLVLSNNNGYTGLEYPTNNANIPVVLYPFYSVYLRVNMKECNPDIFKNKIYFRVVYTCIQYSSVKIKKLPRKEVTFPENNIYTSKKYIFPYFSKTWNLSAALGGIREGKYRIKSVLSFPKLRLLKNDEVIEESNNILLNFDEILHDEKNFMTFEIEHRGKIFSIEKITEEQD